MSIQVKFETTVLEGVKETKIITDYGDSIFSGLNVVEKYINLYLRKYVLPWYKVDNTFVISTDVTLKITDDNGKSKEIPMIISDTELMAIRKSGKYELPLDIVNKLVENNRQENITSCIIKATDIFDGGTLNLNITNLFNVRKVLNELDKYNQYIFQKYIFGIKQMIQCISTISYELITEEEGELKVYQGTMDAALLYSKLENDPTQYVDLIGELVTEMKNRSTEM